MVTTVFGTCRVNEVKDHTHLNDVLTYSYSTKEIIQLLKFLRGELRIPEPYNRLCFRTAILQNQPLESNEGSKQIFDETSIFVMEVPSSKSYVHNGYYMHSICVDDSVYRAHTPTEVLDTYTIERCSLDDELESDLLQICELVKPRPVLFVSHYDVKRADGEYLPSRHRLIEALERVCGKHGLRLINPTKVLSGYAQEEVMSSDLVHYTELGLREITRHLDTCIEESHLKMFGGDIKQT